jgi:hypothetical protein
MSKTLPTTGDILPDRDSIRDIGATDRKFRKLYVRELVVDSVTGGGVSTSRQIVSGDGLTGGGNLTSDVTLNVGAGDGISVAADSVSVNSTVVRTTRTLTAGDGLSGGGDLSANRSFTVDSTVVRTTRTLTAGDGLSGGGTLASDRSFAVDSTVVRTTRNVIAGAGLTGGGVLSSDVTLNIGAGNGITVAADAISVDLETTSGLSLTATGLSVADSIAGNGLEITSKVLAVDLKTTSGLEVDSSGLALADTVAGNGLSITSKVLAVSVGNGLSISADSVIHGTGSFGDLHTNYAETASSESITGSWTFTNASNRVQGQLYIGVDGAYLYSDDSTTLQMLGSDFYIDEQLQVAGNIVGQAALDISGTATVDGELWAANGTFRVISHTHDYNHSHLIINPGGTWAFDEQFGVDIDDNLLVRGYIVGKHALQLKGSKFITHYDGPEPYETNYTGNGKGHMGQVETLSGGGIYRPGKFGKAIQLGEATTNLVSNPSFETNTTSWSGISSGTIARVSSDSYIGDYCLQITTPGSTAAGAFFVYTTSTHGTYTGQFMIKAATASDIGKTASILMRANYSDATTTDVSVLITLSEEWQLATAAVTSNGAKTLSNISIFARDLTAGTARVFLIDAVQVEAKSYRTPYCDGSLGSGFAWTGTAHASTSTRTGTRLEYSSTSVTSNNIDPAKGTVMMWVYTTGMNSGGHFLFGAGSTNTTLDAFIRDTSGGVVVFNYNGTALSYVIGTSHYNTWTHFAFTWDFFQGIQKIFIDGQEVGSTTPGGSVPATLHANLGIGCNPSVAGAVFSLNGLVDDFVILDRAVGNDIPDRTDKDEDLIRAVYESEAPVFAETSTWHWRSANNLVWADSEGLWMVNSTGGRVLGAYGADSTKSWGGVTLATGDILLGDSSRGGYVLWDDSAVTLEVKGTVKADLGYLGTLDVSGTLTMGTGGVIKSSGVTNLTTGNGLYLDYNAGTPRFRIGTYSAGALTSGVEWNGSALTVTGAINATSGTVTGVLTAGTGNNVGVLNGADATYRIYAGHATPASAPFRVTQAGALTSTSATITGAINASSGSITGLLTMSSGGEVRLGTGTVGSNFTGIRILNSGGSIFRVAGYNTDVLQAYLNSDGKLYTGNGKVILENAGIVIDASYTTAINFKYVGTDKLTLGYNETSAQFELVAQARTMAEPIGGIKIKAQLYDGSGTKSYDFAATGFTTDADIILSGTAKLSAIVSATQSTGTERNSIDLNVNNDASSGTGQIRGIKVVTDTDLIDTGAGIAIFNIGKSDNMYLCVSGKSGASASSPTGIGIDLNKQTSGTSENSTVNTGYGIQVWDYSTTNQGLDGPVGLFLKKQGSLNTQHRLLKLNGNRHMVSMHVNSSTGGYSSAWASFGLYDDNGGTTKLEIINTGEVQSASNFRTESAFVLKDGITAPATAAGYGQIYIDSADGDLKIKFGDGTVKTIVVDT